MAPVNTCYCALRAYFSAHRTVNMACTYLAQAGKYGYYDSRVYIYIYIYILFVPRIAASANFTYSDTEREYLPLHPQAPACC